jgi:hypothetical protein
MHLGTVLDFVTLENWCRAFIITFPFYFHNFPPIMKSVLADLINIFNTFFIFYFYFSYGKAVNAAALRPGPDFSCAVPGKGPSGHWGQVFHYYFSFLLSFNFAQRHKFSESSEMKGFCNFLNNDPFLAFFLLPRRDNVCTSGKYCQIGASICTTPGSVCRKRSGRMARGFSFCHTACGHRQA